MDETILNSVKFLHIVDDRPTCLSNKVMKASVPMTPIPTKTSGQNGVRETFPLRVGSVGLELMFCTTSNTA